MPDSRSQVGRGRQMGTKSTDCKGIQGTFYSARNVVYPDCGSDSY